MLVSPVAHRVSGLLVGHDEDDIRPFTIGLGRHRSLARSRAMYRQGGYRGASDHFSYTYDFVLHRGGMFLAQLVR
jgi:hypothetical protein